MIWAIPGYDFFPSRFMMRRIMANHGVRMRAGAWEPRYRACEVARGVQACRDGEHVRGMRGHGRVGERDSRFGKVVFEGSTRDKVIGGCEAMMGS